MTEVELHPDGVKPRVKWKRKVLRGAGVLLLVVFVLVLIAPWVLSTGLGNGFLRSQVNSRIAGTFTADDINIGWVWGTGVRGGELRDPSGAVVVEGLDVRAGSLGLLDVLRGKGWGEVAVTVDALDVVQLPGQRTNLEAALALRNPAEDDPNAEPFVFPRGLGLKADVTAKRVSYRAGDDPVVTVLHDLLVRVDASDEQRITAGLTGRVERDGASGVIDAEAVLLELVGDGGVLRWRQAGVEASADVLELPVEPVDRLLGLGGKLSALLGPRLEAHLMAGGTLAAPEAELKVKAERASLDVALERSGDVVNVRTGSSIALTVTPGSFAAFARGDAGAEPAAVLLEPVTVSMPVQHLTVTETPAGVAVEAAQLRATAKFSPVVLRVRGDKTLRLDDAVLRVDSEALGERVNAVFTAQAAVDGAADTVFADVNLRGLIPGKASGASSTQASSAEAATGPRLAVVLERWPVALLDALASQDGLLLAWLGPTLDAQVNVKFPDATGELKTNGAFRSDGLNGPFALTLADGGKRGTVSTPEPLTVRVTPAVLRAWRGAEAWDAQPLQLHEDARVTVSVAKAAWAWLDEDQGEAEAERPAWTRLDPAATSVVAEVGVSEVVLWDARTDQALPAFHDVGLRVDAASLASDVELVGGLSFDPAASAPRPGDTASPNLGAVTLRLTGTDLTDESGRLSPERAAVEVRVNGTGVPTSTLDALANQGGKLAATLGPSLEPSLRATVRPGRDATADVEVRSTYAQGAVFLAEDLRDDVWEPVLTQDPAFTLAISEPAVQSWLGKLHPVFADVVRSAPGSPATFTIQQEGFTLGPGGVFALENINAEATLSLGVLEMDRQGWLRQGVTGLVRQVVPDFRGKQVGRTYQGKFSPMRVTLKNGVVETSEMWLAADDFGVGFAGRADLKRNSLDMGVGVLGATFIAVASDLDGVLDYHTVYELPITGTLDAPKIGYDRFVGQVATSYGQRELARNADKLGGFGTILGDLGAQVLRDAFNWDNPRSWSPSDDAQTFATTLATPPEESETGDPNATPNEADPAQARETSEPEKKEEDDVDKAIRGILDIIDRQRDRQ